MKHSPAKSKPGRPPAVRHGQRNYEDMLSGVVELLDAARRAAARSVNTLMTATYWEIGRRIVEHEQGGRTRAEYGEEILLRLAADLTRRFGRGFSVDNLERFRRFYLCFPGLAISATSLRISEPLGPLKTLRHVGQGFPLPWSHYTRLIRLRSRYAIEFYHAEALRGGWTVKQLERQIGSQFYERTALSKNKATMLTTGTRAKPEDAMSVDEGIRDPLVLEFLNLKDEYSEHELEEALIQHLETFLLELGGDFAFVGRQRRLRIDDEWYRVDEERR